MPQIVLLRTCCFVWLLAWLSNVAASQQQQHDFVPIFDGQTFSGWQVPTPNLWWSISEGVLHAKSDEQQSGRILWTTASYWNFVIELEFRFVAGSVDSGVFLRHPREQIQIGMSGSMKRDMTASPYIDGKGYPVEANGVAALLKQDDWNRMRIEARGSSYTVWLNGTQVLCYRSETAVKQGPIGLQLHAGRTMQLDFRNLRLAVIE